MGKNQPSVSIASIKKTLEPVSQKIHEHNKQHSIDSALSVISEADDVGANYGLIKDDYSTDANNATRFNNKEVNVQNELEILENNAQEINTVQGFTRNKINNILHSLFKILKASETVNISEEMKNILSISEKPNTATASVQNIQA